MTPTRKELMDQLRNLLPAVLPPYQLAVIGEALAETCKLADGVEATSKLSGEDFQKINRSTRVGVTFQGHIFAFDHKCAYCGVEQTPETLTEKCPNLE